MSEDKKHGEHGENINCKKLPGVIYAIYIACGRHDSGVIYYPRVSRDYFLCVRGYPPLVAIM